MKLKRASFALLCLVALTLPFEAHDTIWKLWGLTPVKLILILSLLLACTSAVLLRDWPRRRPPLVLPAALLCAAFLISGLAATEFQVNAAKSFLRYLVGLILLLQVAYLIGRDDPTRRRNLALSLWVGAFLSSLLGLAMIGDLPWAVDLIQLFRPFEFTVQGARRLGATFEYPNTAANYLVLALPLAMGWITARMRGSARSLLLTSVGVIFVLSLVLTYSRGGMTACAVACLLLALPAWRWGQRHSARWLLGAAGLIVILHFPFGSREKSPAPELRSPERQGPFNAAYDLSETRFQRAPDSMYETEITLRNTGFKTWRNTREQPLVLSFRWYDIQAKELLQVDEILTQLPVSLHPGRSVHLRARYRTPKSEGYYYLIWDLFQYQRRMPWSTRRKIIPGIAECFISDSSLDLKSMPRTDPYKRAATEEGPDDQGRRLPRLKLWGIALKIFRENPWLGIGGGNFRLVYGRYLGLDHWDTKIQANGLLMEILVSCGMVGLLAVIVFVLAAFRCIWRNLKRHARVGDNVVSAEYFGFAASLLGFGLHHSIDYFMEFTPTYVAFWIVLGLAATLSHESTRIR